MDLITLQKHQ